MSNKRSAPAIVPVVDDLRAGAALRAARIRRGWRQRDLASRANVSATTISRVEHGRLDGLPLRTIREVAAALEIRAELRLRSRDADLERLVNARHPALAEAVIAWIRTFVGWTVRPELSFSVYGERGAIDLVAWHAGTIVALRSWLRAPRVATPAALRALVFFSDNHHRNVRSAYASVRRVRRP